MSENIPLKTSESIEFGRPVTVDDQQISWNFLVMAYNDTGAISSTSSTHDWVKLLVAFRDVFSQVMDESFTLNPATDFNNAIGFLNIGRLARLRHESDSYTYTVANIANELNRKLNGVICTTTTGYATFVPLTKWIIGGQMDGFIGSWNSTKYKPADDILAGLIIVLCYVSFWWTGFLKQYKKLIKKLGTFASVEGVLRGNFQPLINSQPATWGSLLLASENLEIATWGNHANDHTFTWDTVGQNLFGLTQAMVDDPVLRGVQVCIYTHANAFWDSLLNRTTWEWKHAKTVSYEPIFLPIRENDAGHGINGGSTPAADCHYFNAMQLFNAAAGDLGNNWTWWNWYFNDTVSMFKDFFFRNASFAKIKSLFSFMPFSAVPEPPEDGLGGLLVYQMADWIDGGVDEDDCKFKGLKDTTAGGHTVLCSHRASDTNFRFLTIGDITLQTYRTFIGLTAICQTSIDHGVNAVAITNDEVPLILESGFGFMITKTEDLMYKVDRHIHWFYGDATYDSQLEFVNGTHGDAPGKYILPKTWVLSVNTDLTNEFPIGSQCTKVVYYYGRASDPFKKLKHEVHDFNHLDAEFIRKDMLALFWPNSASTVKSDPIVVSAIEKPVGEIVGGLTTEESKISPVVSSIASATKAVTEAKKDVTAAQKDLSKEKAKEK